LPLLRDRNSIVRNRAFGLLQSKTAQNIAQSEPEKWEQWWTENKASFGAK
jgi:hypothetical protein